MWFSLKAIPSAIWLSGNSRHLAVYTCLSVHWRGGNLSAAEDFKANNKHQKHLLMILYAPPPEHCPAHIQIESLCVALCDVVEKLRYRRRLCHYHFDNVCTKMCASAHMAAVSGCGVIQFDTRPKMNDQPGRNSGNFSMNTITWAHIQRLTTLIIDIFVILESAPRCTGESNKYEL